MSWRGVPCKLLSSVLTNFCMFFERSEAEGRVELGMRLAKKKVNQKKGTTTTRRRRLPPIFYPVKLSIHFLSKFLSFSPSFNLQKHFLMFSTSTNYPKYILRKQFSQKKVFWEKKNQKKLFIFFSFDFFFPIFFFRFFFFRFFFFHFFFSILFFFSKTY